MTRTKGVGAALVSGLTALLLAGCGHVSVRWDEPSPSASPSPASADPSASTTPTRTSPPTAAPTTLPRSLRTDLERVVADHQGSGLAVAITPVGSEAEPVVVGRPATLVAWSTIKVPLAVAASRRGQGAAEPDVRLAIRVSDNDAALRLWESLGPAEEAAGEVQAVLREGGDARTSVNARVTVPGASPYGQTLWRLDDQARFAAGLPCLPGAEPVRRAMGEISPGHAWGLGTVDGARFKGGWGQTPGGYVVRQLGVLPVGGGREVAVAMQARSSDHASGTRALDALGAVLDEHRTEITGGRCPA